MANVKRTNLSDALAENDEFQLAIAAAVKLAYAELTDDLPDHIELAASDYSVLVDVVVEHVRGTFRGDVTMINVDAEYADGSQGHPTAIRVEAVA